MRRGSHTKNRNYEDGSIDIFALVSLQHMNVVFRKPGKANNATIKDKEMRDNNPVENILEILGA